MAQWLEQSTSITVRMGPFLDETNGKDAETALSITQADIRLSKNGGDFAQSNDSGGATHDENGWYYLTLDATDTGTLGRLVVAIHESGALPVWNEFMVVPSNVWDSFFGADKLQVHADEITAGLITATAIATGAIDADAIADNAIDAGAIAADAITSAKIATGAIDADAIASDAITAAKIATDAITSDELATSALDEIADAVWNEDTTGHTTGGTFGEQCKTDIDAILDDTGTNGVAIADGAITSAKIAANAIGASQIADSAIDAATFAAGAIDASAIATGAIDADAIAGDAITAAKIATDAITSDELATSALDEIAASVWDLTTTGHATAGTFGEQCKTDIDAILDDTGTNGVAIADGAITSAKIAANAIGASQIADSAIDAATFAAGAIDASAIAGDAITAAKIANGAIDAATFAAGAIDASAIATGAIDADAIADNAIDAGAIAADAITAAKIATDAVDADALAADAIAEIGTEVNAEVSDVLKTDTISEMTQQAPPATPTFEEAVMYLYMALRNQIDVDSSYKEFHNDSATVIWKKALSDSGTVYTEAEGVTGP